MILKKHTLDVVIVVFKIASTLINFIVRLIGLREQVLYSIYSGFLTKHSSDLILTDNPDTF